jgi:CheY-like chemotaxis protein
MFGDASIVLRGTFVARCMHYSERLCMRLLLVEDNEELAQLLSQRVQAAGYEADLLVTAADALTAVMTTRYAAMVLDLGLPEWRWPVERYGSARIHYPFWCLPRAEACKIVSAACAAVRMTISLSRSRSKN